MVIRPGTWFEGKSNSRERLIYIRIDARFPNGTGRRREGDDGLVAELLDGESSVGLFGSKQLLQPVGARGAGAG